MINQEQFERLLNYLTMRETDIEKGLCDLKLSNDEYQQLIGQSDELRSVKRFIQKLEREVK